MPEETKEKESTGKPTNCMKCNKRLQRKTWYYRNEGYYCSKRCWKLAAQAAAEKKEKKEKEEKEKEVKAKQEKEKQKNTDEHRLKDTD